MAFDLSTAKPAGQGFDLSTAKPIAQESQKSAAEIPGPSDMPENNAPAPQQDSSAKNIADVVFEFASSVNRPVAELLDFLGPDTANAVLNLVGSDKRVGTLSENIPGIQGGFMDPGAARTGVQLAGNALPMAAGFKTVQGRDVASAAGAVADFVGAGASATTQPIARAAERLSDSVQSSIPSQARKAAELPLKRGSGDVTAAGFKLDDTGRVIGDKVQQKALKSGIDEGAVAMIAAANKPTKKRMKEMVEVLEAGRGNMEYRNFNPPQKVIGEAINDRLKIIQAANEQAANRLDSVASSLKGESVDVSPAMNTFIDDLQKEGIGIDLNTGTLDFSDSTIEGENLSVAQGIINNVFRRLYNTSDPSKDAFKVHIAKRFIDEQVTYGRSPGGLSGKMDGIVKRLRSNLDGILDQNFPAYDQVNTTYKETRDVIDEVQSLAGKKVNLRGDKVDKAMGTMSRKVLSNYNTGTAMEYLFEAMDETARRYSTPLTSYVDDDLKKLISMEAEMRRMFPTATKPNTLQGNLAMEGGRVAADLATGNKPGLFMKGVEKLNNVFSKDDEAKIQALKELLSE